MFCKALYFNDVESGGRILRCTDPKEQKKLGRTVKVFNEYKWTKVKSRVCRVGNWYKFRDDVTLRRVLLRTGEKELCEASRRDRVWGMGFNADEAEEHREEWGENRLGRALMAVRAKLREKLRGEVEVEEVDWEWNGAVDEEEGEGEEELEELLVEASDKTEDDEVQDVETL
ncbi:hypothetical protein BDV96DRAFT_576093 [Lophiotrema nucula]|uniref:NADAR domain-containing protein n=1 Tax=Lophiotrema nucula TaxID=690887 RepID=A0A6A5Z614_9PLEO|nr:hypothetical protein BDV96DRAFT_576093 [Lophiotrema nucula]